MSNTKYSFLFNEKVKQEFLNTYPNLGTRKSFESRLKKIAISESLWNKDLYNFNEEEVQLILTQTQGTVSEVGNVGSVMKSYIMWAIENGYRTENLTIVESMTKTYFEMFAVNTFYTHHKIIDSVEKNGNLKEKIILLLLFEGIGLDEIPYLKYSHIRYDNNSIVINKGRIIKNVSDLLLSYLKQLMEDKNIPLDKNNEYIIKKDSKHKNSIEEVNYQSIMYAVKKIGKSLTPTNVIYSGMLYYAMLLYQKYGKLEYQEYDKIIYRFNQKTVKNNNYDTPPYYRIKTKLQINEESIRRVYIDFDNAESQIQVNPLWRIKEQNGLEGERAAWEYLKEEHPDCKLVKPPDKEGYDIEVYRKQTKTRTGKRGRKKEEKEVIKRVEVKTVQNNGKTIHLTINELEKASVYDNYYIYLVNNLIDKYEIYVIENPLKSLGIDITEFEKIFDNSVCSVTISSIRIKIKNEFLKSLNPIVISKEINIKKEHY